LRSGLDIAIARFGAGNMGESTERAREGNGTEGEENEGDEKKRGDEWKWGE